jgi:hypothetical protein
MERALIEPLPLIYAASATDSIAHNLNKIIGPGIDIEETNISTIVVIRDTMDPFNRSVNIGQFENYIENYFADATHSAISLNFSNISDEIIRVYLNERCTYTNNHEDPEIIFTPDSDAMASAYEINFTTPKVRLNISKPGNDVGGDIEVTLHYTDLNGTEDDTVTLNSDENNTYRIEYVDGTNIQIMVGMIDGSVVITSSTKNTIGTLVLTAVLPTPEVDTRIGYCYDAQINYVQGDVRKVTQICK